MATEKFTKEQFEKVLPKDLWKGLGAVDGEYLYAMSPTPEIRIYIRSSIRPDGIAADTGKDSIRAWLSSADGTPLGSKTQAYVTRIPGWETRLIEMLRKLWKNSKKIEQCSCGRLMGVFKVKKRGPNHGRQFTKCLSCNSGFRWITT